MSLSLDIQKRVGNFSLNVQLEAQNETLALLGASGCGKSMTLRCIAGIEKPDQGRIIVDNVVLFDSDKKINLPPQRRRVGLMFQNYALFPNMTVLQNIRVGARWEKNKSKQMEAVQFVLEMFDLKKLTHHYPHQLSGGQQQRVALARILVSDPCILLLDEPFSALDSHLRFRLEQEVRSVIRAFGKSVLLVSHDRDEVYRMADLIAVMRAGQVEVCGKRKDVFSTPVTRTGAVLTGCKNISAMKKIASNRVYASDWGITLTVPQVTESAQYIGIRMHDICPGGGENTIHCHVVEIIENPFSIIVMLQPEGTIHTVPIGWEMDKEQWANWKADVLDICLPSKSLLLLEE